MPTPHQPLHIFVVEPDELTRRGAVDLLRDGGFRIAGEAGSLGVAQALALRTAFDILLVEPVLPDGDGTDLIRALAAQRPDVRSVALSASKDDADLVRVLLAGAAGYLTKDIPSARLAATIAAVARGEAPLSRAMTAVLVREFQCIDPPAPTVDAVQARLTPREWEVLNLLAEDMRTSDIVDELVLSVETVRSHIKSTLRKLGVHTRARAVALLQESKAQDGRGTPDFAA